MKKLFFYLLVGTFIFTVINWPAHSLESKAFGASYGLGNWKEIDREWQSLYSLTIHLPEAGFVYVDCDGFAFLKNCTMQIAIGIDYPVEDTSTRRFYSFTNQLKDPQGIHASRMFYMTGGSHTIYFLGRLYDAGDQIEARANHFTISALWFKNGQLNSERLYKEEDQINLDGSK